MIHPRIFRQACIVALIGQFLLVLVGYAFAAFPENILLLGRLLAAGIGGYWYGVEYGTDAPPCALGGSLCGGLAALPAVILSVSISATPGSMVPIATGACMLAGGLGGWIGFWAADRRGTGY